LGCGWKLAVIPISLETNQYAPKNDIIFIYYGIANLFRWLFIKTGRSVVVWEWHRWLWTAPMSKNVCPLWQRAAAGQETTTIGPVAANRGAGIHGAGVETQPRLEAFQTTSSGNWDSRTIWVGTRTAATWKTSRGLVFSWPTEIAQTDTFSHAKFELKWNTFCFLKYTIIACFQGNPEAKPVPKLPDCPATMCTKNVCCIINSFFVWIWYAKTLEGIPLFGRIPEQLWFVRLVALWMWKTFLVFCRKGRTYMQRFEIWFLKRLPWNILYYRQLGKNQERLAARLELLWPPFRQQANTTAWLILPRVTIEIVLFGLLNWIFYKNFLG
jgi:hypothetical protein